MMGIFSTKINNVGAVAGMLSGLTVTLVYIFLHKVGCSYRTPTASPMPILCSGRSNRHRLVRLVQR